MGEIFHHYTKLMWIHICIYIYCIFKCRMHIRQGTLNNVRHFH